MTVFDLVHTLDTDTNRNVSFEDIDFYEDKENSADKFIDEYVIEPEEAIWFKPELMKKEVKRWNVSAYVTETDVALLTLKIWI